ncbi:MAG: repressor LexA [Acidobacteria bacterium]|nr:repressor LexA [Acidobacteriota bacterium]
MQPRTKRQKEILEYISNFIETRGYKPSYQQIAKHFRLASKAAVAKHIEALEKQGLITRRRENGSFSLELFPKTVVSDLVCEIEWLELPETTRFLDDFSDETLLVPTFLIGFHRPEKLCAVRVQNDAMLDDHICEGDIALIEKREFARDGDIVLAVVNGDRVYLKRLYRDGANIELRPANDQYEVLSVPADKIEIKGIYRGLIRPII